MLPSGVIVLEPDAALAVGCQSKSRRHGVAWLGVIRVTGPVEGGKEAVRPAGAGAVRAAIARGREERSSFRNSWAARDSDEASQRCGVRLQVRGGRHSYYTTSPPRVL